MPELIDLTHTFDDQMPVYPGDPLPTITPVGRLEVDGYNDCCVCTGMHVGTHMDAPLHMIANGERVATIAPERFFGRGVLVDARGKSEVSAGLLDGVDLQAGDIVVVLTGWYHKFKGEDYYPAYPEIAPGFATRLVDAGVSILALDTPSPDRPPFAVHKILLGNGVLIIENLTNVEALLELRAFTITALPAKFDWEAAPVRVIAQPINSLRKKHVNSEELMAQFDLMQATFKGPPSTWGELKSLRDEGRKY
jgi:kynurenine formamidase